MVLRMDQLVERRTRGNRRARLFSACTAISALIFVTTFGAQAQRRDYPTRAPADPAAVERGKALYGVNCQFCHGADTRGGDSGSSLLRSQLVQNDQNGEVIAPVVQDGRPPR